MKIVMLTTLMVSLAAAGHAAGPSDYGAMVQGHSPLCAQGHPGIERTAAVATGCCDFVRCSQMLATTKVDRPHASSHT